MTTLLSISKLRSLSKTRLFSDQPEESLRLRILVLLTVLWVALALNWVTGRPWIPLAAGAGASLGLWINWRQGQRQSGYRSAAIVLVLVGLSVFMRDAFVQGLAGDRLPIAEYLLLVSAIASFGLKTRGGLYAQLALSGIVLFFIGERAFDQMFVGFLIGFIGLFLTFTAMAFMEDQIRIARVHWPEGQLGRFWFWLGIVGGGLLVFSALAFSLLPPDYRGSPGSQRVGIVPFMGEGSGEADRFAAGRDPLGPGRQPELSPSQQAEAQGGDEGGLEGFAAAGGERFGNRKSAPEPRDVVMHVRSKVTSYWRGRVFDEFDGRTWYPSTDSVVGRHRPDEKNYYWQAYFVEEDQPRSVFVGYNPVRVILPQEVREQGVLLQGSTYSVLSQQPTLTRGRVALDRAGITSPKYLYLPPSLDWMREMSRNIVQEANNPFEQLWLIASHLRHHHSFDVTSQDQVQLSGSVDDFLVDGTPGTSLDFASATVLLARAAGLPARIAVGYLPGKFDPFSGTHRVRRQDEHAWAEVYFARNGWVSFDATPRPELEVFTKGGIGAFGSTSFIFQTRVGGGLYHQIRSGATAATDRIAEALEGSGEELQRVLAAMVALLSGLLLAWLVHKRSKVVKEGWSYSRLPGEGRNEVLRTYKRLERQLRRRGLKPRGESQTLGEYSELASEQFKDLGPDVEWLKRAAWAAAYDPAWPGPTLAREAAERLAGIWSSQRRFRGRPESTRP